MHRKLDFYEAHKTHQREHCDIIHVNDELESVLDIDIPLCQIGGVDF
jgi:hypothetical protein